MQIVYEELYGEAATPVQQLAALNEMVRFLGCSPITSDAFNTKWAHFLDPDIYRWASTESYQSIPGIEEVEKAVGSNETGWIFRE
jgi:hypothetical protein